MLNQDFKEFIRLLNDNQVRYLVVGGYATQVIAPLFNPSDVGM
jgi:hypothetical protein